MKASAAKTSDGVDPRIPALVPVDTSPDDLAKSVAQHMDALARIRHWSGARVTRGLAEETIGAFLCVDASLGAAIDRAVGMHLLLRRKRPELLAKTEPAGEAKPPKEPSADNQPDKPQQQTTGSKLKKLLGGKSD